jgi:YfiH family protein
MSALPLLRGEALASVGAVAHGFTTRTGGASTGALATLNLGRRKAESDETLSENWRRVVGRLLPGADLGAVAVLDQVHGADVARVTEPRGPLAAVARADAAFTTERGVVLAVKVADCVPVIVAGEGIVGVAHAGWRGTAAAVVRALVRAMREERGGVALAAAVGPCIGVESYEVGPEVVAALRAAGLRDEDFLVERSPRPHVDLGRAVLAQLAAEGVAADRVARSTAVDPDLYSHRRDGPDTGRSAGVVALC